MLRIFSSIAESHETNGAKYQDWERYSQSCASNVRSLRSQRKDLFGCCTSSGKFTGKSVPSIPTSTSLATLAVRICVWECERAWSSFMQVKGKLSKYGSSYASLVNRHLRHARRRLGVALKYAQRCSEIAHAQFANSVLDAECCSYARWVEALLASEDKRWSECYAKSMESMQILQQINLECFSECIKKRIETYLSPLVKFAQYNLKKASLAEPAVSIPEWIASVKMESLQLIEGLPIESVPEELLRKCISQPEYRDKICSKGKDVHLISILSYFDCIRWATALGTSASSKISSRQLDVLIEKFRSFSSYFQSFSFPAKDSLLATEQFLHALKVWILSLNETSIDSQIHLASVALDLLSKIQLNDSISSNGVAKLEIKADIFMHRVSDLKLEISRRIARSLRKSGELKAKFDHFSLKSSASFFEPVECKPIYFDLAYNFID